jgi:1,4-alpha-glucan branching enzyme
MLQKVPGDELGTVCVTFELDGEVVADSAAVAGDFNDWSPQDGVLDRGDDGVFRRTVVLEVGRTYRFRYLLDGERWVNAIDADDYEPNRYGGDDSVVRTDDIGE